MYQGSLYNGGVTFTGNSLEEVNQKMLAYVAANKINIVGEVLSHVNPHINAPDGTTTSLGEQWSEIAPVINAYQLNKATPEQLAKVNQLTGQTVTQPFNAAHVPGSDLYNTTTTAAGVTPNAAPAQTPQTPAPQATPAPVAQVNTQTDQQFNQWLSTLNLSPDQKTAIQAIYDAVSTNDIDYAARIDAAMKAATQYSDPYFKAQIRLVTDALDRGLHAKDGDLQFQEKQLANTLTNLKQDIATSKEFMSFQQNQELQQLARNYEGQLENTQNDMAQRGFTTSSIRSRAEQLLNTNYQGLVQSSNRQLAYKTGQLNAQQLRAEADTAAQIENLRRLTSEGKIDALRRAEAQVGSTNLSSLGYTGLLGGVGGEIPAAQAKDALSFANSFIF